MKRCLAMLFTAVALGTFSYTSTSRAQWVEVPLTRPEPQGSYGWQNIYFTDSLNGWVVSEGSDYIARTRNGGRTWDTLRLSTMTYGGGNAVYFGDTLHGIVAGHSGFGIGPGKISRTTDGGRTWSRVTHPASNSLWQEIAVVGDSFWVVGSYWDDSRSKHGIMLRASLSSLFSSAPIPWRFYEYPQFRGFREIAVISPSVVWLSGSGWNDTINNWQASLCHTTDGGRTFQNDVHKVPQSGPESGIHELVFQDSQYGWLGIDDIWSSIWRTTDGGDTWAVQSQMPTLPAILPLGNGNLFTATTVIDPGFVHARILKSTNYGASWLHIAEGVVRTDVVAPFRLSNQHMWFVGGDAIWYYQHVEPPTMAELANDTVIANHAYQKQVQASGLGLRYALRDAPPSVRIDSLTGLISSPALTPADTGDWRVAVTARDTVWQVVADTFNLLVRQNRAPVLIGPRPDTVAYVDSLYLWRGTIEDFDGDPVEIDSFSIPSQLSFALVPDTLGSYTAVVEGVFHLADTAQTHSCYISLTDRHHGYLVLQWRIRVQVPTLVTEMERPPDRVVLRGNYPNPFNSETFILFSVPSVQPVRLEIHDPLGRKVRTLVSELLQAGEHRVRWNGLNDAGVDVSSGVYLYRLVVGNYSAVKKMLLVR